MEALSLVGGIFFVAGSACFYAPDWAPGYLVAALVYTGGASLFLLLDMRELRVTPLASRPLRTNLYLAAAGTALYVLGSAALVPAVYETIPVISDWSYVLGSVLICASELWKAARAARARWRLGDGAPPSGGAAADVGISLSNALGAAMWLVGALFLVSGLAQAGPYSWSTIHIWMAGSICFTVGGAILASRRHVARLLDRRQPSHGKGSANVAAPAHAPAELAAADRLAPPRRDTVFAAYQFAP